MDEKNKHDISDTIRNREDDVLNVPRITDDRDVNVINNIQVQQVPSSATTNLMSTIDIDELIAKFSRQGYYLRNKRNKYKTEWKNSIEDGSSEMVAKFSMASVDNLIEKDVLKHFIELLSSPHIEVVEQAIWGIGNIAGDNHLTRDCVINSGALEKISSLL